MENRKRPPAIPIALIAVIAYVALFPNLTAKELVARVAWSRDLTATVTTGTAAASEARAFRVGDRYGYVDTQGRFLRLEGVIPGPERRAPEAFGVFARVFELRLQLAHTMFLLCSSSKILCRQWLPFL